MKKALLNIFLTLDNTRNLVSKIVGILSYPVKNLYSSTTLSALQKGPNDFCHRNIILNVIHSLSYISNDLSNYTSDLYIICCLYGMVYYMHTVRLTHSFNFVFEYHYFKVVDLSALGIKTSLLRIKKSFIKYMGIVK